MKTVFKSDEIAHIWANRGAPYGRSPGNLSFDGDAIKSYATVIGRRIEHKGREAYVRDNASFSVSTSKSQDRVRQALPDSAKVFHIHAGARGQSLNFTPATLRDWFIREYREKHEGEASRYAHVRAEAFLWRVNRLASAIEVCEHFGLASAKLVKEWAGHGAKLVECRELVESARARHEDARKARDNMKRARRIMQAVELAESIRDGKTVVTESTHLPYDMAGLLADHPDLLAVVEKAQTDAHAVSIAAWIAGSRDVYARRAWPTLLRAEDDEMVTTKGARVPLDDARRTYRFALAQKTRGWHRNGETHAIGAYQLDAVNEAGVVAGCHRVTWAEINRFATVQGWTA